MLTVHLVLVCVCGYFLRSNDRIGSDYTFFFIFFEGKAECFYLKKEKKKVDINDIGRLFGCLIVAGVQN